MSYKSLGALPSQVSSVLPVDVAPIFAPSAPPLSDSTSGTMLAILLALTPAAIVGSLAGAHLATYDEKQSEWAKYGALLGVGVASVALLLDYARPK